MHEETLNFAFNSKTGTAGIFFENIYDEENARIWKFRSPHWLHCRRGAFSVTVALTATVHFDILKRKTLDMFASQKWKKKNFETGFSSETPLRSIRTSVLRRRPMSGGVHRRGRREPVCWRRDPQSGGRRRSRSDVGRIGAEDAR